MTLYIYKKKKELHFFFARCQDSIFAKPHRQGDAFVSFCVIYFLFEVRLWPCFEFAEQLLISRSKKLSELDDQRRVELNQLLGNLVH